MARPLLADEFEQMAPSAQIQLVQDLWDQIANRPADVAVSQAHLEELTLRLDDHIRNPDDVVSWESVQAKLTRSRD